jgi:signal transduction histidine kinase
VDSLFEDSHGQIWVTTHSGVAILKSGRFSPVSSVPQGIVFSIAEDHTGTIWLSHQEGLFRLLAARMVERIPWAKLGRGEPAIALGHDPSEGGLWLGFSDGDVVYFKQGELTATYALGQSVGSLHTDAKGTLWAATTRGLARIKGGRVLILTSHNGLPCNTVHWMMEGDADSIWLYTACGLVRMAQSELDAWASNPKSTIHPTVFDTVDGVRSQQFHYGRSPIVAKDADGKLWFLPFSDVSVLDPHHLHENKLPPPVHIEQITADGNIYDAFNGLRLPPRVRNLSIDYTALSLVAPEKVRFRYKLEGQDENWREVGNDRRVQYSNLAPGTYHFRVKACNNSGVWNEEGATLDFVIPPMWYQTNWFRAVCAAIFLSLLWAAYQVRVRQLAHQFNMRLEERVSERTRIARDLHDTLLQSFQALLPRLQAGIILLSARPNDARRTLEEAAEQASQAIAEGRDAVQGLRMSTVEKNDLAVAIRTLGEELAAAEGQSSPNFNVVVEGTSRNLHPILRDEVYRLATEALHNAFRHAAARNIEVEIRYDEKYFRLRVRDDGIGIPSDVLGGDGREGHYGLPGMRERANLVGGKLTIWTERDSGTEIELNIPSKAYVKSARRFWYFGKRSARETDDKEAIERE